MKLFDEIIKKMLENDGFENGVFKYWLFVSFNNVIMWIC